MRIGIIGGGASGLVASIFAKTNDNEVTILERNSSCGKKLLMTGNGRCNYWNADEDISHFHSVSKGSIESILTEENQQKISSFFSSIGIIPKIKNGYYYPYSREATSMKTLLLEEAKRKDVKIITNFFVEEVLDDGNCFQVRSKNTTLVFDKLILACGGMSYPKTGSDGNGYRLAQKLHHTVTKIYPSLVQVLLDEPFLKEWAGLRLEGCVSLYEKNRLIKEETGELQLTDYGISGICVLNISRYISLNPVNKTIKINFLIDKARSWFRKYVLERPKLTISQILEGLFPYKMVFVFLKKMHINETCYWKDLSEEEKNTLENLLFCFTVKVKGTKDFECAQVSAGGISLEEIDIKKMESKKRKNLYFVGELVDVDADCGGYNLTFAWLSGMIAGLSCSSS